MAKAETKEQERQFLPYGRQSIDQDDIQAVTDVLTSDFLTTGPEVAKFETALANATGAKEAIVCGNGTQALHLACMAAGLKQGDYAIVPSLTFLATANAVRYCGADVIFADVDPDTGLMMPQHLLAALAANTDKNIKAVLPVHLRGQCVDMEPIRNIADEHGLTVINDSCHALGSTYKGSPVSAGKYEHMSCFSFHPVKTIAMGEGGAITTNDSALAKKMRSLRTHGMVPDPQAGPWAYDMPDLGYNYRACDMQCALGTSQLKKLDHFVARRRELARMYDEALKPLSNVIQPPKREAWCDPAWHLYSLRIDFDAIGMPRADFMNELKSRNIGSQVHYIPVHTQPYYTDLYGQSDLPGAMEYYEKTLSIPLFPAMQDEDVTYVVEQISEIANK